MEPIKKLWSGVDTVKVNFGVAWPDSFAELLETLDKNKQLAMEAMEPVVFALAANKPFDQVVALHKGSPNARYGIQVEGLTVFFSARQMPYSDTPNLYVEAGPEFVAENGMSALHEFVRRLIAQLGGEYLWNKVSEVHLTVDMEVDQLHTDKDYRQNDKFLFVTRARTKVPRYGYGEAHDEIDDGYASAAMVYKGDRLETMQVGKNQMMLRIYDKQAELKRRPRKAWERLLWSDPNALHVLRVEFQLRRESLKLLGFDTIEDVLKRSGDIWAYLTRQWFRLYTYIADPRPMSVLHPFWMVIQDSWDGAESRPVQRRKVFRELRVQRAQQVVGHATGLAALTPRSEYRPVVDLDGLMELMRSLLQELLPEPPNVAKAILEKRIRFQCRNKANMEGEVRMSEAPGTRESEKSKPVSRDLGALHEIPQHASRIDVTPAAEQDKFGDIDAS